MENYEEKNITKTMVDIYSQIEERDDIAENTKISNITYYNEFVFSSVGLMDKNLYIVKLEIGEEKEKRELYEIYNEYGELIATVDVQGKIHFTPEYIEALREIDENYFETLKLEDAEFKLPEELEEQDLSIDKEQLEKEKEKNKKDSTIEEIEELKEDEEVKSYSEIEANQKVFEKITNKQELDPDVKVTQSETLSDMIPEVKEKGFTKIGIVYSENIKGGSGRFSFVGITQEGEIELIDDLQNIEGSSTGQTITSINSEDGSVIEEEQVARMVKINRGTVNGQEEYLSVRIGQYGILEVDYVRADLSLDESERYFSAPIETQNIRPTTAQVREIMDRTKNTSLSDEQKRANPEIARKGETKIENIDEVAYNDDLDIDDIIVLEDGTQTTIRKEADKAKVSPEEFLNKYEKKSGKTPDEIIENVHEEIEEEYLGSNERTK